MFYFNNANTGNNDWTDTSNWYYDSGANNPTSILPSDTDEVTIESACSTNVPTSFPYPYVYVYAPLSTSFETTIESSCIFYVTTDNSALNGDLSLGAPLIVNGSLYFTNPNNSPSLSNLVTVNGYLNVSAPTAFSGGLTNNATTYLQSGTSINNLTNTGDLFVNALTQLYVALQNTGTIAVASDCYLYITGALNNGTINNTGNIFLPSAAYTLINNNTINCPSGGNILIDGTLTNNGTINITNSGKIAPSPSSTFTNNGTFTYGSYSTTFRGRIFPQVPSSASWGNALL